MIKFFRKIRQKLLSENKFSKYLIYAIGEIALVMIGILLAFQVNSWKEQRDNASLEKVMMKNLNTEFKNNLLKLNDLRIQYEETDKSIRRLMSFMQFSSDELNKTNIDSLIAKSIDVYDYSPTQNSLTEILATGNLKLITKDSLKTMLLEWSAELNEKEESWQTLDDFNQNLVLPYLTKKASMRNIDKYSLMKWEDKSKFKVNYVDLFNDIEFENHLDNLGWAVVNYKMTLERLQNIVEKIIVITND
ncbi:DUF6090 family protein [Winogradskyella pulchriflava]|uniref:DUF6090 family protein n=1 Tax=Winogradskyella pulchriflava TaxID=1110688 RepID=A0ABV6QAS1_9FLAO